MQIGRVAKKDKLYSLKAIIKRKKYTSHSPKVKRKSTPKIYLGIIILALALFGGVTFIDKVQNKINNYYVNAQASTPTSSLSIEPSNVAGISTTYSENEQVKFDSSSKTNYIDKRAYVLDRYLEHHQSPLAGKGQAFVDACDKYGAPKECIVTVAIAYNETHLCKYHNSAQMHNCWGFGGPGVYRRGFSSYEEGIDTVTKVLTQNYGNEYMIDPEKMEKTFCGTEDPMCENWGNKIKYFMNNIREFAGSLGIDMAK